MIKRPIIPGVLSISSTEPVLKGFPLCENLNRAADLHDASDSPLEVRFQVNRDLRISNRREGKAFRKLNDEFVAMEVPIGRWANVTCAVALNRPVPELQVNRTFHRTGKLTIGNVHSVGWLLRSLCNTHLLNNGFSLIHGAALKTSKRCVLLIGLSNTGKTTTVSSWIQQPGVQTFGDDLLVSDGKSAFSCPNTAINVDPSQLHGRIDKILQRFRRTVPFYEYIGPTSSATLATHFGADAIAQPTSIDRILILQRSDTARTIPLDSEDARSLLVASNAAEFTYSRCSLFRAHDFLLRTNTLEEASSAERRILGALCENAECFLVNGGLDEFAEATASALERC